MEMKALFKGKGIKIILGCALVLTLLCVIKMLMPLQSYHYDRDELVLENAAGGRVIVYDKIALPIGVYDVELNYQTDTNMKNLCVVQDTTVFAGGLLTNGEHLYAELGKTDFRIWLFENTENLQVGVDFAGEGYVKAGALTIRETNALWTMLLTCIWAVTIALVAILALRNYGREIGIDKEKKIVIVGLLATILISSLPYLQSGNMHGTDLVYHLMRIEGVKDGLLSGQVPLRIEPEWLFGHGYANGVFYCNILLYFPALLRLLGFTVTASYNLYCIAINVATACISYYCFSRIFKSRYIGLMCSALYTLSIFRIYKLMILSALGEGSAVMFMPLVLYGLYRVFTEDVNEKSYKTAWIPIAFGYGGLMQTHVLSCEITAFLTFFVCLVCVKRIFVKQTFLQLAKGALAAVAMSFWYLVPFLDYYMNEDVHIHYVYSRTMQERGLYLPQLFFNWWKLGSNTLSGDFGVTDSLPMGVGLILGVGFVAFAALWYFGKWRLQRESVIGLGKISFCMAGLLMLMSLNIFPWDYIQSLSGKIAPFVSSIQFPHRFLGWGTVFLVVLYGCVLWYFGKNAKKIYFYLFIICALAATCTSNVYLLDYACRDMDYLYVYNEEGMSYGNISGGEYLLQGTEEELIWYDIPSAGEGVEISGYEKDYLHMFVSCANYTAEQGYVELPLLHYTGYRAYSTTTGEQLPTSKGTNNVVKVDIPAGFDDEIEVKFVSPLHWRISELVTCVWYISAVMTIVVRSVSKRRGKWILKNKQLSEK